MRESSREYRHNNHSVGMATVHLVWIPKRRKPVLVGDVRVRLAQIINEVAAEKKMNMILVKQLEGINIMMIINN